MPFDYITPFLWVFILVIIPLSFVKFSKDERRGLKIGFATDFAIILLYLSLFLVPRAFLWIQAENGNPVAQYELSRNYVNNYLLGADTESSFYWVDQSAKQKYPPALYALGIMYKEGNFVPEPIGWNGPGGNVFPQPDVGQPLIDEAIRLGYNPTEPEKTFYWAVYRK